MGRAEGMMKMRDELRRPKNSWKKGEFRKYDETDFEDMEVTGMKRRDWKEGHCSRRLERL